MPPDDPSPRQREILATARRLLVDEGVDAVTMGRIAAELGIKPPSLYKHFGNKAEIEALLIADGLSEFADAFEAAGDDLHELGAAYRSFALANPELYRLINDGELPRDRLPEGLEERAAAPLARALNDPDLARAVWAFAHGMVQLELANRFPPDADISAAWQRGLDAFTEA